MFLERFNCRFKSKSRQARWMSRVESNSMWVCFSLIYSNSSDNDYASSPWSPSFQWSNGWYPISYKCKIGSGQYCRVSFVCLVWRPKLFAFIALFFQVILSIAVSKTWMFLTSFLGLGFLRGSTFDLLKNKDRGTTWLILKCSVICVI